MVDYPRVEAGVKQRVCLEYLLLTRTVSFPLNPGDSTKVLTLVTSCSALLTAA